MKQCLRRSIAVAIFVLGLLIPNLAQAGNNPSMNADYTVTNVSYVAWQYAQIPSTNFLSGATSAKITVKGAVFVAFGYALNQWNYSDYSDGVFNWSNDNVAGVTYTITGDVLASAKKGGLYIRTNTNEGLTMIINNVGEGGTSTETPDTPDTPAVEEPAQDVTDYSKTLYEWNDIQIEATAFNAKATSAKLSVDGATYVRISHKVSGKLNTIKEFAWNSANKAGVTYELTGSELSDAIAGNLYIYVGGGNPITLKVSNTVVDSDEPTVDEPTVDEPTVDEPTVDEPTVDEPTVDEPTVDEPTVDEPTVDEPTVDEPTVDEPTVDEPTVDEPTVDEPTVDEPTVDEPTVDEPTVDEPSTDEPTVDEPSTDEPTTDDPTVDEPSTDEPTTDEPTTDEPSTDEPSTDEPSTDDPSTDEPSTDEPTVDEPSTDEPTVDEPSTDEPSTDEPSTDEPSTDEPATSTYGVTKTYTTTCQEWNNTQVPASSIDANADKVRLYVSGACYIKTLNGSTTIDERSWNDANKDGVKLELTGDLLAAAKAGNIYVWVGGGSPIELTVTSFGVGGAEETIPQRDITTLDVTKTADRAYAIANRIQLTDVPTLYITVPDAEGQDINTVLFKDRATNTADYHDATIQVVDAQGNLEEFTDDVQIKVRGNSTADCVKKPYRLKFAKKHKHDLTGNGYSERNWTMLANYLDPSLMRNALTYEIGKMTDMSFCPGYQFVDVVINDEYRGTYQMSDQCEVGKKRINVNEDTGWYVEVSRSDMIEEPCLYAAGLPMSIKNPEPDTDEEIAALKSEVQDWFTTMNANSFGAYNDAKFQDPTTGWRAYWDEESLVNYYVAINMTGDYDGFMTVKMAREADGKMFVGPLWDKDLAYGNFTADNGTTLVEDMNNGQFGYYIKKLMTDPGFVTKVHNKIDNLMANGADETIQNYINQLEGKLAQTQVLNNTKWSGYSSWILNFSTYSDAVQQLRDYLSAHLVWLDRTIDEKYAEVCGSSAKGGITGIDAAVATPATLTSANSGALTLLSDTDKVIVVYSATGAKVAAEALSANSPKTISLPAGIYVVEGKKVVVK